MTIILDFSQFSKDGKTKYEKDFFFKFITYTLHIVEFCLFSQYSYPKFLVAQKLHKKLSKNILFFT